MGKNMKIQLFQVDAFAEKPFEGNPAAVCPLEEWLDDELLQNIAEENNLSETAFFVPSKHGYELRWFTPVEEVDLCGHATLATAHVLFEHLGFTGPEISFQTKSGELRVSKTNQGYKMDFPISPPEITEAPIDLLTGLGVQPKEVLKAFDYIVVLESEQDVKSLTPDFTKWLKLDSRGVIVTALGGKTDFVARCFFPGLNINEDPVTGSAYCELAPYWSAQLNRNQLIARQLSSRSGTIHCEIISERILITGKAVDFLSGNITI